jgi:hypothetical protein
MIETQVLYALRSPMRIRHRAVWELRSLVAGYEEGEMVLLELAVQVRECIQDVEMIDSDSALQLRNVAAGLKLLAADEHESRESDERTGLLLSSIREISDHLSQPMSTTVRRGSSSGKWASYCS